MSYDKYGYDCKLLKQPFATVVIFCSVITETFYQNAHCQPSVCQSGLVRPSPPSSFAHSDTSQLALYLRANRDGHPQGMYVIFALSPEQWRLEV